MARPLPTCCRFRCAVPRRLGTGSREPDPRIGIQGNVGPKRTRCPHMTAVH